MSAILFILLSIVNCAQDGKKFNEMAQSMDILSTIWKNIDTQQLIQMIYDPLAQQQHVAITRELRERICGSKTNGREVLLAIHRQQNKGKMSHLEKEISENVRISVQRKVDEECDRAFCDLGINVGTGEMISNKLLQALAYFDKEIIVPSNVQHLRLSGLRLTSLWLRFEQDSLIDTLCLTMNDFDELNHETFGRYVPENCRSRIRTLLIGGCHNITKIDFDELALPNIAILCATNCSTLSQMKNIPPTLEDLYIEHTRIRDREQLQFKKQTGNSLLRIDCDDRDEDKFLQLIVDIHKMDGEEHAIPAVDKAPEARCQCVIA